MLTLHAVTNGTGRLLDVLLDLASDARDRANGGTLKLGHLQRRREHVLDERRVLEDLQHQSAICSSSFSTCLEGIADELKLLDDIRRLVQLPHDTGGDDAKVLIGPADSLHSQATGTRRCDGPYVV